jgi:hypothetical protein
VQIVRTVESEVFEATWNGRRSDERVIEQLHGFLTGSPSRGGLAHISRPILVWSAGVRRDCCETCIQAMIAKPHRAEMSSDSLRDRPSLRYDRSWK